MSLQLDPRTGDDAQIGWLNDHHVPVSRAEGHDPWVGNARDEARRLLLDRFRWHGGHADFAGVLRDPAALACLGPALAEPFAATDLSGIVAIEARGFVLGALVAEHLGLGLILARKPGSVHPGAVTQSAATPDWRGQRVELRISRQAVRPGDRLLLVDDWIETGSQARTLVDLFGQTGARLVGASVVVDGTTAQVRRELSVVGLVGFAELPVDE